MDKFRFLELVARLKHLPRQGWVNHGIKSPESVAGHMYRMAMCAFLLPSEMNIGKIMKIALVHDLAESIVGDITPSDQVPAETKNNLELEAMNTITSYLPDWSKEEVLNLWSEYENLSSTEAIIVKDLDKFDMIVQAFEYEKSNNVHLPTFFEGLHIFKTDLIKEFATELYKSRESYHVVNGFSNKITK